ncbi:copper-binding protein [Paraburkholderia sp. J12]|uniref:copper-binding protein n=1 Tax=Paraburkholderia sp. J12 TaxID=2805432 RepID=UPI002ABD5AF6|nr:copper-binding protein [Paraburkholderia sp. J12]
MKKFLVAATIVCASGVFVSSAFAGDDMSGMNMAMTPSSSNKTSDSALTDAEVVKVDSSTGMVTLKHGELANIHMAAMTMAYKAKDAAMAQQVHQGEKVRVRVENVGGTLTITRMVKASS